MNKTKELTQSHVHHVLLSVYNRSLASKELDAIDMIQEMKRKLSSTMSSIDKRG